MLINFRGHPERTVLVDIKRLNIFYFQSFICNNNNTFNYYNYRNPPEYNMCTHNSSICGAIA